MYWNKSQNKSKMENSKTMIQYNWNLKSKT